MSSELILTRAKGDNGAEGGIGQGFANGGHPEPRCPGSWWDTIPKCSLAVWYVVTIHVALFVSVCVIALQATAVFRAPFAGRCDSFEGVAKSAFIALR